MKIKTLSLFFIFALLLTALVSCGEDPYYKFSRDLEPLSDEQIEECNEALRADYFGSYDEYVTSKSEDMRDKAEKIYYGMKFIQNNVYTPYLGTFGGAIVCGNSIANEEEVYILDGKVLEMGSMKKITVYKDGKFASISQAYSSGWLTDADVQVILDRIAQYDAKLAK